MADGVGDGAAPAGVATPTASATRIGIRTRLPDRRENFLSEFMSER
jgi:hypothetical protein